MITIGPDLVEVRACFVLGSVSYDIMTLEDMISRALDYYNYLQRMWAL